ncbi:DUF397 domain-containing protein [Kitasatospora sp. NPDC059811]|uniref:DUF397 domain-containing protein n=1 Tax=Streptomycetaceae TaxID=2062 RepID=UPI0007AEECED|nr:DUF397 domain-containing protein [Streptomyces sp. MJM8645]
MVTWRKSSYSAGDAGECIEVALAWHKSSYSGDDGGECIEVALGSLPAGIPVRDSKDPGGPVLVFPASAWTSFLSSVQAGDFPEQ